MDIIINTNITNFESILKILGLTFEQNREYTSYRKKDELHSYHIYFYECDGMTCCEIHYELILHLFFLGVDYEKKPRNFFDRIIKPLLENENIEFKVLGGYTWFSRRNKAILSGFKKWNKTQGIFNNFKIMF